MNQGKLISLYHPTLKNLAYSIIKCKADAEDILQDTYIKFLSIDLSQIQNIKAFLIRMVINNCRNHIKTTKRRKDTYLDDLNLQDHPEQIIINATFTFDLQAELSEALAILQSKLEPLERAVYLLKEVFDYDYDTLQETLDKRKDHCRQLFSRARRKLYEEAEKIYQNLPDRTDLYDHFKNACEIGNSADFVSKLKLDITNALRSHQIAF